MPCVQGWDNRRHICFALAMHPPRARFPKKTMGRVGLLLAKNRMGMRYWLIRVKFGYCHLPGLLSVFCATGGALFNGRAPMTCPSQIPTALVMWFQRRCQVCLVLTRQLLPCMNCSIPFDCTVISGLATKYVSDYSEDSHPLFHPYVSSCSELMVRWGSLRQ